MVTACRASHSSAPHHCAPPPLARRLTCPSMSGPEEMMPVVPSQASVKAEMPAYLFWTERIRYTFPSPPFAVSSKKVPMS